MPGFRSIKRPAAPAPKKSLGQHFLLDQGVIRKMIAMAAFGPSDRVMEIGPATAP